MSKGTEALGNVLNVHMKDVNDFGKRNPVNQLGTITSGRGLKLDGVPYTIPQRDYMVSRSALLSLSADMPACFRPIQQGDRVLVAMVGTEPIVIDIVIPADSGAFGG